MTRRTGATFLLFETTPGMLRQVAEQMGIVADRGPRSGDGSASALIDLIAGCAETLGPDNVATFLRHLVAQREAMIARHEEYKATH